MKKDQTTIIESFSHVSHTQRFPARSIRAAALNLRTLSILLLIARLIHHS